MTIDFDGDVSLVEKLVQHGTGTVELVEQKLLLDSESEYEGTELGVQDQEVLQTMEEGLATRGPRWQEEEIRRL
ncbi:hypothetical protein BHE74_00053435 [Ensete ventricosum]|nr:hypothetical protein BHE74_00053435 [Ensete ventricosum]RZS27678.1 hypothetical protein BHM03_00061187 [Ensete ventricosum]